MEQIMRISRASDGQLISTLQDIRTGRKTEIEFLNLEIARVAASMQPKLYLPRIELLGKMILAKSLQQRRKET
jgi:2-dehydropantoate 2-reductase